MKGLFLELLLFIPRFDEGFIFRVIIIHNNSF